MMCTNAGKKRKKKTTLTDADNIRATKLERETVKG